MSKIAIAFLVFFGVMVFSAVRSYFSAKNAPLMDDDGHIINEDQETEQ